MTYEELKAEAKRQGYRLSKIQKNVPHIKCVCCNGRGALWLCPDGYFIGCKKCTAESEVSKTERGAWKKWYEMNERGGVDEI